jgi:hypothetical protein
MKYSFYTFLTTALEGGVWSASRSGRDLAQEKEPPVPILQEAGWAGLDAEVRGNILCLRRGWNTCRPA